MRRRLINSYSPVNWASPLNKDLVSWWLAGYGITGYGTNTLVDLCRKNNGILTNSPTWGGVIGRPGWFGSLLFNGLNYVDLGDFENLEVGNNFTFAAWVYRTGGSYPGILCKTTAWSQGTPAYTFYLDNFFQLSLGVGFVFVNSTLVVPASTWTFVAATNNSQECRLYMGTQFTTHASFSAPSNIATSWKIGTWISGSGGFVGNINQVRVSTRALASSEIYASYEDDRRGNPQTLNWIRSTKYFLPIQESDPVIQQSGRLSVLGNKIYGIRR